MSLLSVSQVQATFSGGLSEHLQAAGGANAGVAASLRESLGTAAQLVDDLKADIHAGQKQLIQLASQRSMSSRDALTLACSLILTMSCSSCALSHYISVGVSLLYVNSETAKNLCDLHLPLALCLQETYRLIAQTASGIDSPVSYNAFAVRHERCIVIAIMWHIQASMLKECHCFSATAQAGSEEVAQ